MNPDFVVLDPRFNALLLGNAFVETLWTGSLWAEGPVWFGDAGHLLWSDIPNNRIMRWTSETGDVSVYRQPAGNTNGHTRDRQGRLVSCEHGNRRVTRTEHDGRITVLADAYEGKRLNSPNDVVVKSDGTVWFSDPSYGILSDYEGHKSESEIGACHVYRCDPATGAVEIVADDFDKPNGLAFSVDEKTLYVSDTGVTHTPDGPHHIRAFDVKDAGTLSNSRVFAVCDAGLFDGFRLDTDGNIWSSAGDGIHCLAPDGTLLGKILIPETVANVCFGGPKKNRLFITATTSLYSVYVNANGQQTP
jgi:gluconolactonase